MSAALYALAGTVIGILGTVLLDIVRGRRETRSRAREVLRVVCSDFTTQLTRARRYSGIHHGPLGPVDQETWQQMQAIFTEARTCYERMLITADSVSIQAAARCALHYTFWMWRTARTDDQAFKEAEAQTLSWLKKLYVEVRRELGIKSPGNVYEDPHGGLPKPGIEHNLDPGMSGLREGPS